MTFSLKVFFRLFLLGNVAGYPEKSDDLILVIAKGNSMGIEPKPPAFYAGHLEGQGPRLALKDLFGEFPEGLTIFRYNKGINRFALGLIKRIHLDHLQSRAVHHNQGPVGSNEF